MYKISVIIPCYNVGKYIDKCLNSLIKQTFTDYEIILVDDSSSDNTLYKINKYIEKYDDINILFLKENSGPGKCRNEALKVSKGEYVLFLDSDDYLEDNSLELMYNEISKDDNEILVFNYTINDSKPKTYNCKTDCGLDMFNKTPHITSNKLFKKSFLIKNNILFLEEAVFENIYFNLTTIPYINKIKYLNQNLFYFNQRENSLSNKTDRTIHDLYHVLECVKDYYSTHNILDEHYALLEYLYINILLIYNNFKINKITNKKVLIDSLEQNWYFLNKHFPTWKKNKYLKKNTLKNVYFKLLNYKIYKLNLIRLIKDN